MVGTTEYTAIGRPSIGNARVYATIEEHSQTEKVIIFKKRRRKGYQKNAGHRQLINVMRKSSLNILNLINIKFDAKYPARGPLTRRRMRSHYPLMK